MNSQHLPGQQGARRSGDLDETANVAIEGLDDGARRLRVDGYHARSKRDVTGQWRRCICSVRAVHPKKPMLEDSCCVGSARDEGGSRNGQDVSPPLFVNHRARRLLDCMVMMMLLEGADCIVGDTRGIIGGGMQLAADTLI